MTKNYNKKIIKNSFSDLYFKLINLNFSKKIVFLGIILGFYSLYKPWIIHNQETIVLWNSFNSIAGNIGYFIFLLLIVALFILFSTTNKEKLKLYTNLSIKTHYYLLTISGIIISFCIISLNFINGLTILSQNLKNGDGIIYCFISGIIILIGGLIIRNNFYKNSSESIEYYNFYTNITKKKKNMKLPF